MDNIEKTARELVENFFKELQIRFGWAKLDDAKACAIICVEVQLELAEKIFLQYGIGFMGKAIARNDFTKSSMYEELQSVKKFINDKL